MQKLLFANNARLLVCIKVRRTCNYSLVGCIAAAGAVLRLDMAAYI